MKVYLCQDKSSCPAVEIMDNHVVIGEDDNICTLTQEQFNILKEKVKNGEI